jgi:hypothetical protein
MSCAAAPAGAPHSGAPHSGVGVTHAQRARRSCLTVPAKLQATDAPAVRNSGLVWGIVGGLGIGLPPVLHFGSEALQQKVAPGCLSGDKFICLAITEPYAGSDVASIRTTAVKDASGRNYIVNGEKKWCVVRVWLQLCQQL